MLEVIIEFAVLSKRADSKGKSQVDLGSLTNDQFGSGLVKSSTALLHLVRTNVFEGHENDRLVSGEIFVDSFNKFGFVGSSFTHNSYKDL